MRVGGAGVALTTGCSFPLSGRFFFSLGAVGDISFSKDRFTNLNSDPKSLIKNDFSTLLIDLGASFPFGVGAPFLANRLYSSFLFGPAFISSFGHLNHPDQKVDAGWGIITRGGVKTGISIDLFPRKSWMITLQAGALLFFGSDFSRYDNRRPTSPLDIQPKVSASTNSAYFFNLLVADGVPPSSRTSEAVPAPPSTPNPVVQKPVNLPSEPIPSLDEVRQSVVDLQNIVRRMINFCQYFLHQGAKPDGFPDHFDPMRKDFKRFREELLPGFLGRLKNDIREIQKRAQRHPGDERWGKVAADILVLQEEVDRQVAILDSKDELLNQCLAIKNQPPRVRPPTPPKNPVTPPPVPPSTPGDLAPPAPPPADNPEGPVSAPPSAPPATNETFPGSDKKPCPHVTDRVRTLLQSWSPANSIRGTRARELSDLLNEAGIRNEIRGHVFQRLKERVREELKSKKDKLTGIGIFQGPHGKRIFQLWMKQNQEEIARSNLGGSLPGMKQVMIADRFKGLKIRPEDIGILFRTPETARGAPSILGGRLFSDYAYCQTATPAAEAAAIDRMHADLLRQYDEYQYSEEELSKDFGNDVQSRDEAFYELLPFVDSKILTESIRQAFEDCGQITPQGYELVAQVVSDGLKDFQRETNIKHFRSVAGLYAMTALFPPVGAAGRGAIGLYQTLGMGGDAAAEAISTLSRARTYNDLGLLSDHSLQRLEAESAAAALNRLIPGGGFGATQIVTAGAAGAVFSSLAYHMATHEEAEDAVIIVKGAAQAVGTAVVGAALGAVAGRLRQAWKVAPDESLHVIGVSVSKPEGVIPKKGSRGGLVVEVRRGDGSVKEVRKVPGTISGASENKRDEAQVTITPEGGSPVQVKIPKGSSIAAVPKGCKSPDSSEISAAGAGRGGAGNGKPATPPASPRSNPGKEKTPPAEVKVRRARSRSTPLGAEEFDVGSYKELRNGYTKGKAIGEIKEEYQMDHIPSKAGLFNRAERRLKRPLTEAEKSAIEEGGVAIAVPAELHRRSSQTFGSRNDPQQISDDGISLRNAFDRDAQAYLNDARKFGYSSYQIGKLRQAIFDAREANIKRGVFSRDR